MNGRKKGMNGGGKLENENQAAKKAYFQQAEALYLELVRDVLRVTQF
jgi:hypothetical protein